MAACRGEAAIANDCIKSQHDVNVKLLSSYKCSTIQPFTTANPRYYRAVRRPYTLVGVLHRLAVFACMRVEHSPCVDASENAKDK